MSCSRAQRSDAFEALNRGRSVSSHALSYCAREMLCSPEHSKQLKLDCFTEPQLAFAFMNKSFATVPAFMHMSFATGDSSLTRVNSNVSCFAINVYKKWSTV